jgi:hypothetical protein
MHPYTDDEWDLLPHVILTSDLDWDPTVLDHTLDDDEHWYDAMCNLDAPSYDSPFDSKGNYHVRVVAQLSVDPIVLAPPIAGDCAILPPLSNVDDILDRCVHLAHIDPVVYTAHPTETIASVPSPHMVTAADPDYEALHPYFGWLPLDTVKETFTRTTQYARMPMSKYLKHRFKSPYPALNVHRHNEPIATNTVYSDTPAIDSGNNHAQLFIGTKSLVCDVEGRKT